jgi:hypothetical protein
MAAMSSFQPVLHRYLGDGVGYRWAGKMVMTSSQAQQGSSRAAATTSRAAAKTLSATSAKFRSCHVVSPQIKKGSTRCAAIPAGMPWRIFDFQLARSQYQY